MFGTSNDLYSVEAEQCHITPQGLDLLEGSGYEDRDIEELMLSIGGQGLRLYPRTQGVFIILAKDPSGHPEVIPVLDHAFREAAPYYPGGFDRPIPGYAA